MPGVPSDSRKILAGSLGAEAAIKPHIKKLISIPDETSWIPRLHD
jgi:hypothetical protein